MAVALVFLAGCTGSAKTCTSDSNCLSYQKCDLAKKSCVIAPGFCSSDSECNDTLKTCSQDTHLCVYKANKCRADNDCQAWQVCVLSSNDCKPKAGFCDSDSLCNNQTQVCDMKRHVCAPKPGTCLTQFDCLDYQKCNLEKGLCVPLEGRCDIESDCSAWETCNMTGHSCTVKPGFCENDLGCTNTQVCDPQLKRCVT
ncbi:MAG TPA: hypothetical protein PLO51_02980, partial [Candidatus Micrarchaeota archaeon]|nr:hypothetical protein [Candidatus Micrarchaeota archaeon]